MIAKGSTVPSPTHSRKRARFSSGEGTLIMPSSVRVHWLETHVYSHGVFAGQHSLELLQLFAAQTPDVQTAWVQGGVVQQGSEFVVQVVVVFGLYPVRFGPPTAAMNSSTLMAVPQMS